MELLVLGGVVAAVLVVTVLVKTGSWPMLVAPVWLAILAAAVILWPILLLTGSAILFVFWWLPGELFDRLRALSSGGGAPETVAPTCDDPCR